MKKNKNEIYMLVDEKYLSKFSFNHHTSDILKTGGHYETIQHIGHSEQNICVCKWKSCQLTYIAGYRHKEI